MLSCSEKQLAVADWQALAEKHRAKVREWTEPYRRRKASHKKHPVFDFLFTYYPFSLGKLEQWHPGIEVILENSADNTTSYNPRHYQITSTSIQLAPEKLDVKARARIAWMHNLLVLTQSRAPHFACYGMHEWAMVYKGDQQGEIRHRETSPLRLSQEETDHIVEAQPVCCSHFDAFRFFAPDALKLNKLQPTLKSREDFEQPGCLHTNMDLYKWASKCMPWVGSDLLWACFQLALKARELDMRASPYDLQKYGYAPIKIETQSGRDEYEVQQRDISQQAQPLRQQIIDTLARVLPD